MLILYKIYFFYNEIVIFELKENLLGILVKFLLIVLGIIYLLMLLSPFLFRILFSNLVKKQYHSPEPKTKKNQDKKPTSDSLGEYIDYEEVE